MSSKKIRNQDLAQTASFLYEVGTLRKIARAHRQTLLTNDLSDNISSHSYRTAIISLFLAYQEKANVEKVLLMSLFHDTPETRSNDQNWIHKRYVKVFENEIIKHQMEELPFGKNLLEVMDEYEKRMSLESKIAKDADLIDQVLLLKEYEWQGNKEAAKWLIGKEQGKRLQTSSAKKLVKEICRQNPSDWWQNLWTAERR